MHVYVCTHAHIHAFKHRDLPDKSYASLKVLITMWMRVARSCAIVTAVVTMITQNSAGHRDTSKTLNLHIVILVKKCIDNLYF